LQGLKWEQGAEPPSPLTLTSDNPTVTTDLSHPINSSYFHQEAQLMLTNPRDALRGQSRSPNMVSFDMLGMVSYYSNFIPSF